MLTASITATILLTWFDWLGPGTLKAVSLVFRAKPYSTTTPGIFFSIVPACPVHIGLYLWGFRFNPCTKGHPVGMVEMQSGSVKILKHLATLSSR